MLEIKDLKEIIKISYLYYKKNLTQDQIAKKMNTSRQRVNRILKKAIEENIVTVTIMDLENYNFELEDKLQEKFNLKQAIVASSLDEESIVYDLGLAGVRYILENVEENSYLGISFGRTISKVSELMPENTMKKISVVQLTGGTNILHTGLHPDQITRSLGKKLGGESYVFFAPAILEDENTKNILLKDINMINTEETIKKCKTLFVGIGEINESTQLFTSKKFNDEYRDTLLKSGSKGDIGLRWFDKDGRLVKHKYDTRTLGYNALINENKSKVVGIAGGEKKYEAILGALNGGFLDVLITDSKTAEKLIKED